MQRKLRHRGQTLPPKKLFVMVTACISVCHRLIPEPLPWERGSAYPFLLLRTFMLCFILNWWDTGHKIPCSRMGEGISHASTINLQDPCSPWAQCQQHALPQTPGGHCHCSPHTCQLRLTISDPTPPQKQQLIRCGSKTRGNLTSTGPAPSQPPAHSLEQTGSNPHLTQFQRAPEEKDHKTINRKLGVNLNVYGEKIIKNTSLESWSPFLWDLPSWAAVHPHTEGLPGQVLYPKAGPPLSITHASPTATGHTQLLHSAGKSLASSELRHPCAWLSTCLLEKEPVTADHRVSQSFWSHS